MTTFSWTTATGEVVQFDGSEGVSCLMPLVGLDVPPVELQREQQIAYDGSRVFRYRAPNRPFALPLLVDETVVSMRQVAAWFVQPGSTGTLVATTDGLERTLEQVVYEGGLEGVYSDSDGGGAIPWRRVTLNMSAEEPWWQGPIQSTFLNFGAATGFNAAIGFNDVNTPFNGGDSKQVAVSGDTYAFPTLIVDGPFTTFTLNHPISLESVTLAAALADGDRIVIDANPSTRGSSLNGGSVDWTLITDDSRPFTLLSPADTVSINSTGSGANSQVEMQWRNRYLTP